MSAPVFAWAFEQGHKRLLTSSQLLLLLYMADQADCSGQFHTGQPRMAKYTRLSVRTVRAVIGELAAQGLVEVHAVAGRFTRYNLNMQPQGAEMAAAPEHAAGPANGSGRANGSPPNLSTPRQPLPPHPGNLRQRPRQNLHGTPATIAADPLSVPKKETLKTRVTAREAKEGFQNSEHQGGTPTPEPIPKAPILGTTQDCSQALIQPSRQDEPLSIADTLVLLADRRPPRDPEAEAEPEPATGPRAKAVKRAVASTIYSLRKYAKAEGVAQMRTREQQRTEVLLGPEPPPPAAHRGPVDPVMTQAEQLAELQRMIAEEARRPEQPVPKLRLVPTAEPPEELPPIPPGCEATVHAARRALLARA